ncbi:TPA: hypothetical protein PFD37_000788 [Vibrio cholerae]|nr:hypothetical protein [Vibrio cholerae]
MRKTIVATALLLVAGSALAEGERDSRTVMSNFSYDYVEARIGASPMTFGAAMSRSVHPNAHVIGRIDSEFESDYDVAAGFGFHAPVNNWADLTGEMLFRLVDDRKRSSADTGMELNIGIRQWLGPQLEVGGKAGYYLFTGYPKPNINSSKDWKVNLRNWSSFLSVPGKFRFPQFQMSF